MVIKVYLGIWAAFALTVLGAVATGNLTGEFGVIAGMFAFGLIFMGMLSVIPLTLAPKPHEAHAVVPVDKQAVRTQQIQIAEQRKGFAKIPNGFNRTAIPRSL